MAGTVAALFAAEAPAAAPEAAKPLFLPPLREDVRLLPGAHGADGRPSWTLHDPARHRFIRIGWLEFEILARWGLGRSDLIVRSIREETPILARESDISDLLVMADRAGLVMPITPDATTRLARARAAARPSAFMWVLKHYLFLRWRVLDPDRLLGALERRLAWMLTPAFGIALALAAALGLYLVSRQWQTYSHAIEGMFTLEGAAMLAAALTVAKVFHELGHGVMTKRFGCRVPGMGVAFIVLWPVLWTDTTDAWRLTDRRKRLAIDAAGMLAEIVLAVAASLAWCVLQDGALRSAALTLSSSTWVLTVLINTNPLMRFDGYYLMSDLLDLPNLQDRSFALTRWWLREALFGLGDPVPERLSPARQRLLIGYGFACWVYRFSLFLGIALLVYHLTFKALGIFLMAVEIWWFILRPIVRELAVWRRRFGQGARNWRQRRTLIVGAFLAAIIVIPWRTEIHAPGLLRAEHQLTLQTTEAGVLTQFAANGSAVQAGQTLDVLASADISFHLAQAKANLAGLQAKLQGQGFDPDGLAALQVSSRELDSATAELVSVQAQQAALTVKAPFAGIVADVPEALRLGQFLPRGETVGILLDPSRTVVEAYVSESDIGRLALGNAGMFYPENGEAPVPLRVTAIGTGSVRELETVELGSVNGGGVAVRKMERGALVPDSAIYRVTLTPTENTGSVIRRQRGGTTITGERISLIERIFRQATSILIRESGF